MKETIYENSDRRGLVDFAYLAVNDKIIVNKTTEDECGLADNNGFFDNEIWFKLEGKEDNKLTVLLTFDDSDDWETSLQKTLVDMSNEGFNEESIDNILAMFYDALYLGGFSDTYVGKIVQEVIDSEPTIYYREVDFKMHFPNEEDNHPGYDT